MASRLELQTMLENLLGSKNVYFQPPPSIKMSYPAIVYSLSAISTRSADDRKYIMNNGYQLVYIDRRPDSDMVQKIGSLPQCSFNQHFVSDNLNHYNYTIYY